MADRPAVTIEQALQRLTAPGAPFETAIRMIDGRPVRTYVRAPGTLRDLLQAATAHPERTYLHFEGEALSYRRVLAESAALAAALYHRSGVRKGDRLAICMRNFPEWATSYWAAIRLGAIVVPVNAWGTGPELAYVLAHSGARVLVADEERLDRLGPHLADLEVAATVAIRSGSAGATGRHAFEALLEEGAGLAEPPDPAITGEDDATIFYTSGTTGRPKGAVGSHLNAISCIISGAFNGALSHLRQTGEMPVADPAVPPPVYLYGGPLFHVGGCNSGLAATMANGGTMVLMHRWDAGRALQLIERLRIAAIGAVPTMIWQLLDHPDFARFDLSSLRSAAIGGAAAGPELHARLRRQLPHVVAATGYGATETSGGCTFNGGLDYAARPASVGVPAPVIDVRCVAPEGDPVPPGTAGELCLSGAGVVRGYWRDPEATAASFRDGWFHSGDIASIDADGRITILDRAKDMVIRGGENVYSIEVEDALMAHPAVLAAAVFGLPDRVLGERVVASVQVAPGADVSDEALQAFLGDRIARFKVPDRIDLTQEPLPRNETGKILKRTLRATMLAAAGPH